MSKNHTKPLPPTDNQCCGNACNPCVWDNYYAKLREWRIAEAKIREQQTRKNEE